MREAETLCNRLDTAILEAGHLLAGALVALAPALGDVVPSREALLAALADSVGAGDSPLDRPVRWGPGARDLLSAAVRHARESDHDVTAASLALAALSPGVLRPGLVDAAGLDRATLAAALEALPGRE